MRDIKFRCYVKFLREMHEVREMIFDKGTVMIDAYQYGLDKDDAPVMQFTGLIDKNGTEIYEGDIVKVYQHDEDLFNHRVEWNDANGCCSIGVNHSDYDITTMSWAEEQFCYEYEVIGNIHQNPELLKD